MKLLLDTTALIDFLAGRRPYADAVCKLCIGSVFGDLQLWVSTQSFVDAYYVLRKSNDEAAVKQAMLASLEFFLPCGTYAADLKPALESDWPDVEDYLVAYSTKHIQADYLITRDTELIDRSPVPALSAAEFLVYWEETQRLVYDEVELL